MARSRRALLAGGGAAILAGRAARAQRSYPEGPLRIVVPYAPGGGSDVLARLIAPGLQSDLGQSVIVDNRAGAGGQLGAETVMRSRADGLTLLLADMPVTIVPALHASAGRPPPFDPPSDFAPITLIGETPMALYCHPSSNVAGLDGLVAAARARPGGISIASGGIGTVSHLLAVMLQDRAAISLLHVPYRGGGPAMQDLVAGQVHLGFTSPATAAPMVQSGTLRALAVTSADRQPTLPAVPTFSELGLDLIVTQWYGLMAPAGTPDPILDRLARSVASAVNAVGVSERWQALGMTPRSDGPSAMRDVVRRDTARWAQVVRDAGIRVE